MNQGTPQSPSSELKLLSQAKVWHCLIHVDIPNIQFIQGSVIFAEVNTMIPSSTEPLKLARSIPLSTVVFPPLSLRKSHKLCHLPFVEQLAHSSFFFPQRKSTVFCLDRKLSQAVKKTLGRAGKERKSRQTCPRVNANYFWLLNLLKWRKMHSQNQQMNAECQELHCFSLVKKTHLQQQLHLESLPH